MCDVTRILGKIESGDPSAAEQLLPLVYEELRKLAAEKMAQEKPDQTLQATALVHEAYIRLVDVEKAQHWNSRGHFFGAAAEAMRRIIVEQARRKRSLKKGGKWQRQTLPRRSVRRGAQSSLGRRGLGPGSERGAQVGTRLHLVFSRYDASSPRACRRSEAVARQGRGVDRQNLR